MLPAPAATAVPRHRGFHTLAYAHGRSLVDLLPTRTRAKTAAVLLLSTICCLSILLHLRTHVHSASTQEYLPRSQTANVLLSTIRRHRNLTNVNHLVLVPCHAIWKGVEAASRLDEENWILEPYQKGLGRVNVFLEHIIQGSSNLAISDARSLLVFSGGQTKSSSTFTESESYLRLALSAGLLEKSVLERTTTENHALDSYQNLLFSIARFHEYTGVYPKHITVVGYQFKQARFTDLHRRALRWPTDNFRYIGIDPDEDEQASRSSKDGELQNGYMPYSEDPYGCHSFLLIKRRRRNPFSRYHSYYTSAQELASLLDWCPDSGELDDSIFPGPLPWH
ncbi:hypothetical protein FA15DRAFT_736969 [Coprinopsis marcescibilis]|uniref:DUF218 domain-containing protein n=1 Tax=Coprinopsis marcescibilis TaxID=230819 RepID=A0A5C3L0F3_COPMA|nr:hypothetical protein FA15DRAFT_736969 [Coprinopsis marcescibilis]